ncbi:MAG TPA: pyridoxal phosphate-dependent aminotransferase [Chthonomonadaceae bacterium]|nr:pyridoxal phosphate-dependent aminotransferase [Chthonomonadaceae bacterium]
MQEPFRMQAVQSPVIPIVGEMISRHPGTISLGQGVVHYPPPPQAVEAIARFLSDPDNHKYRPVQGIPPLLEAIAAKLRAENGIDLQAGRSLVVTAGANMAFLNAILAVTDPSDEIILLTPYYFNHDMAVAMAGCRPVTVATDENYQPRLEAIEAAITERTRAILTISPNNPTGAVYAEEALRAINALCRRYRLYHISDEAYEYFTYDGARHFSPGSLPGSESYTISLYSLSKAYGFASWRIGYMVLPEQLLVPVKKIQDTMLICPPVISQYAAVGALEAGADYCRKHLRDIAEVRQVALEALRSLQPLCTVPEAKGAFYFLLKIHACLDPMRLVERLIAEHRVAALPGTTFGMEAGCYLRVSYGTLPKDRAMEGIGRLVEGLRTLLKE